jgi:energy-coupling factor transporter ATP-binding protein EcfA2
MATSTRLYAINLDEIAQAIIAGGHYRTVLVQGHMGSGKSSLLNMLAAGLPKHVPCYFDCTTKDLGDITIPDIMRVENGSGFVRYLTNEELGVHNDKPVILMIDEYGKANPAVKNALLRLLLERKIGSYTLHPDSIVFATTNLGAEGVGDLLPAHARNRLTVIESYQANVGAVDRVGYQQRYRPDCVGVVPQQRQGVRRLPRRAKIPDENDYVYHPRSTRTAFVTPRSLEAASDWMQVRDKFDDKTLTSLLIGTIGPSAAGDMMAFARLADQLPSIDSIKSDPHSAVVPTSAGAVMMVVYKVLSTLDRDWVDAWMDYMLRLSKEAQGVFANGVRSEKYTKRSMVMTNKKFTQWAMDNNYLFTADKK